MAARKTCDRCQHYKQRDKPIDDRYVFAGECGLIEDSISRPSGLKVEEDQIATWDYEGYISGAYVGPKFGCIHWTKKV